MHLIQVDLVLAVDDEKVALAALGDMNSVLACLGGRQPCDGVPNECVISVKRNCLGSYCVIQLFARAVVVFFFSFFLFSLFFPRAQSV